MKNYKVLVTILVIFTMLMALAACSQETSENGTDNTVDTTSSNSSQNNSEEVKSEDLGPDPDEMLSQLLDQELTKSPTGEAAASYTTVELTDEEIQQVKDMKLTAAISMQYMGNDWSITQVNALKDQFAELGIEVIAVTDANFKPEKQTSDIESILAKDPDILVSIPVDTVANAPIYKKAAEAGIKVVFMNQAADGLTPGEDYVTVVSPADYGNGARAAYYIARELDKKGKVGIIYYDANFPTTEIRYEAAQKVFAQYPQIEIAETQGIQGPDFVGAAEEAASAMLLREPDLDAIWGIWDVPAEGIIQAVRNAGRSEDVIITTIDLGKNVAIDLANKNGMIKGIGAQTVYEAGITEANAAALGALGKDVAPLIAMDGLSVDRSNLLESWERVYNTDAPQEIIDLLKE